MESCPHQVTGLPRQRHLGEVETPLDAIQPGVGTVNAAMRADDRGEHLGEAALDRGHPAIGQHTSFSGSEPATGLAAKPRRVMKVKSNGQMRYRGVRLPDGVAAGSAGYGSVH